MKSYLSDLAKSANSLSEAINNIYSPLRDAIMRMQREATLISYHLSQHRLEFSPSHLHTIRDVYHQLQHELRPLQTLARELHINISRSFSFEHIKDFQHLFDDIKSYKPVFPHFIEPNISLNDLICSDNSSFETQVDRIYHKITEHVNIQYESNPKPNCISYEGWIQIALSMFSILLSLAMYVDGCYSNKYNQELISSRFEYIISQQEKYFKHLNNITPLIISSDECFTTLDTLIKLSFNKNSEIIGTLRKGQKVIVLERQHKYCRIQFFDNHTGQVNTGWILKKHLKKK